jgi:hypothetical protein
MLNSAPMSRGECHRFHCCAAHVRRGPLDHSMAARFTEAKRLREGLSVEPALHRREVERSGCEVAGE